MALAVLWHALDFKGSAYNHSYMTVFISYHCKKTPLGSLHAEKTGEAVLLYVFNMVFPATPHQIKLTEVLV